MRPEYDIKKVPGHGGEGESEPQEGQLGWGVGKCHFLQLLVCNIVSPWGRLRIDNEDNNVDENKY